TQEPTTSALSLAKDASKIPSVFIFFSAPLRLCGESCLPRPTEAGRHAVDREQQGHEVFTCVAAGGAGPDAAEELDLLAAGAVQHGQAAVEAAAVVGEPVEQRLLSGEAQEVKDGAAVFGLDQGEDVVAQVGVGHEAREASGDGEVDQRQGLLDLVD